MPPESWMDLNCGLLREDGSAETMESVREEFGEPWNHPWSLTLAEAVVTDVKRIAQSSVHGSISGWKKNGNPASAKVGSFITGMEMIVVGNFLAMSI